MQHLQSRYTSYAINERAIEEAARRTRQLCRVQGQRGFNICKIIEEHLFKKYKEKGQLKLALFIRDENRPLPPAWVQFGQKTILGFTETILHVDLTIWDAAEKGDPDARFVLAHEIGHIILHDLGIAQFSNSGKRPKGTLSKEHNVEWQADTFAKYFLLPDEEIIAIIGASSADVIDSIEFFCKVGAEVATERLQEVEKRERKRQAIEGSTLCMNCGGRNLLNEKRNIRCLECNFPQIF